MENVNTRLLYYSALITILMTWIYWASYLLYYYIMLNCWQRDINVRFKFWIYITADFYLRHVCQKDMTHHGYWNILKSLSNDTIQKADIHNIILDCVTIQLPWSSLSHVWTVHTIHRTAGRRLLWNRLKSKVIVGAFSFSTYYFHKHPDYERKCYLLTLGFVEFSIYEAKHTIFKYIYTHFLDIMRYQRCDGQLWTGEELCYNSV